jgi:membrane fusion protein (multidrug efflux system)
VVGIRQVNLGQYLTPGQAMVSLQAFDPIYVNFYIPQQDLGTLSEGQEVSLRVDAYPGERFRGKITALDSAVDSASRNVQVQATIENGQDKLRPGMFAQVSAVLGQDNHLIAVPTSSVSFGPEGEAVYVVADLTGKDGKKFKGVRVRPVQLGESRGDLTEITKGLKAGEEIVTSGIFRLRDQAPITINNNALPESELAPKPANS